MVGKGGVGHTGNLLDRVLADLRRVGKKWAGCTAPFTGWAGPPTPAMYVYFVQVQVQMKNANMRKYTNTNTLLLSQIY